MTILANPVLHPACQSMSLDLWSVVAERLYQTAAGEFSMGEKGTVETHAEGRPRPSRST